MGNVTYSIDIATYMPGRDPRKCKQISVLDGQNFVIDYEGPHAFYGNAYWHTSGFSALMRQHVTELRCGDALFFGTPEGVYYRDDVSHILHRLFDVTLENVHWPWSVAYVGGMYYFAQYEIGLWQYNPDTGDVRHVKTPVYDRTIWVCASNGRLVYLTPTEVSWSAQDDGSLLTPSLSTGAGSQLLSILGGTAFRVDPIVDGVIVATSQGLLKGTKVDEVYVFTWRVISRELRVLSPSAAVAVPDTGIIYADEHGLHYMANVDTDAAYSVLKDWEPEFSDALRQEFLRSNRAKTPGNIMLYYSYAELTIFVAWSNGGPVGFFSKAYAYFVPTGKWGVFNSSFTGLFDLPDDNGQFRGGFLDSVGECRRFADLHYSEITASEKVLEAVKYLKPVEGSLHAVITDTANDELTNATTGDLELNLAQAVTYTSEEELWYSDYDQSVFSDLVVSGLYSKDLSLWSDTTEYFGTDGVYVIYEPEELTGSETSYEPDLIDEELSGTVASPDDALSAALVGEGSINPIYGVEEELCFSVVGFELIQVSKYALPTVGLKSSVTIGPIRYVTQEDAAELNTVNGLFLGTASFGVFAVYEDWSDDEAEDEDYSNSADGAADEDWGIGIPTSYNFAANLQITRDAHSDTAILQERLVPCNKTEYSVSFRTRGITSVYSLLKLDATSVGDFFYLKSLEIEGQTVGALF